MQAASQDIHPSSLSSKRSLTHINLSSTLELVSQRNDGRRLDGLTLGPWYRGLILVWDVAVMDTFAQGHYKDCLTGWFCCYKSWGCKMPKIPWPPKQLPFSISGNETTGVCGKSTARFLSGLAKKLVDVSGDPSGCQWLHQHLSLAVVKGNAASILAYVQVRAGFK